MQTDPDSPLFPDHLEGSNNLRHANQTLFILWLLTEREMSSQVIVKVILGFILFLVLVTF